MKERTYIAIDLKSFYASVECMQRCLDPITTNLVVADAERTTKTICLAVSPSLKSYGIPGRPRLFEVIAKVKEANQKRIQHAPDHTFTGSSSSDVELKADPSLAIDFVIARPQMARYIELSTKIYNVYLKYIAPEDIHVYSIDEVFMDVTDYLGTYQMTAIELARAMILDVFQTTGITATAGIGSNLYLCKVAMDIVAKHIPPDENGVRIAELDEMTYRKTLWNHTPLTDFWRVGHGYAKKLEAQGLYTMGDIARCSIGKPTDYYNEELLFKMFGVNAELLIDHAWGWEPCTIAAVKAYKPESNSLGSGQVLHEPYTFEMARIVVREMIDLLVLDLVDKGLVTDQIVLTIGYDIENLNDSQKRAQYKGEIKTDYYGRTIPKHAHGTVNLKKHTSSTQIIMKAVTDLYDKIVDHNLLVRRVTISANHVITEADAKEDNQFEQMNLFTDYSAQVEEQKQEKERLEREKRLQKAMLDIKKRYGKNAILRGMNLQEGATAKDRNAQIGGHRA